MRRNLTIIFITAISLVLSACSFNVSFVVMNTSNAPLEVEYVVTSAVNSLENTSNKPYKTTVSNWNKWFFKEDWNEIPQEQYEFDPKTRKCKIKLAPNEVLKFMWINDSTFINEDDANVHVENLRLSGVNGEIFYEGKRFYKQFERKNDINYFVTYR